MVQKGKCFGQVGNLAQYLTPYLVRVCVHRAPGQKKAIKFVSLYASLVGPFGEREKVILNLKITFSPYMKALTFQTKLVCVYVKLSKRIVYNGLSWDWYNFT